MKKVLIVDDDFLVRTYLKQMIAWEERGFYIVGDAKNGQEALEILQHDGADILIADVSMPIMDGIELTRWTKKNSPRTHILILSCHDDFIYVKEAMKLGIDDYLLKNNLTEETLLDALNKISFDTEENDPEIERLALIGRKKLREDFFHAFDAGSDNLDALARDAELSAQFQSATAFMIIPKNLNEREQLLTQAERENFLSAFSEMTLNTCRNLLGEKITAQIFVSQRGGFFHWCLIVEVGDKARETAERLQSFAKLYFNLELKIFMSSPKKTFAELADEWQKVYATRADSFLQETQGKDYLHPAIRLALRYIDEHYREEISQTTVAEAVYLNPSYFSTLFKKSVGKGFSDYLTDLRIEHVKERLTTSSEKINAIATSEGFSDYQYFVKIFKRITGLRPSQYREKFLH